MEQETASEANEQGDATAGFVLVMEDSAPSKGAVKVPQHWKEVYNAIATMRASNDAPVDVMGCGSLGSSATGDAKDFRFSTLVALMLSSQTKDEVTAQAMKQLFERLSSAGGIRAASVSELPDTELNLAIRCVGFHNNKTKFLKKTAVICRDEYGGDIPPDVPSLCKLPGVGPKMAYLAMQEAWKQNAGIGVDLHVHRISNRLKWCKTKEPEDTRKALEGWLPREYWSDINRLLVGFGQQYCTARNPRCAECLARPWCSTGRGISRSTSSATSSSSSATGAASSPSPSSPMKPIVRRVAGSPLKPAGQIGGASSCSAAAAAAACAEMDLSLPALEAKPLLRVDDTAATRTKAEREASCIPSATDDDNLHILKKEESH